MSSLVNIPDSAISVQPLGVWGARDTNVSSVVWNVRRSRLFIPMSGPHAHNDEDAIRPERRAFCDLNRVEQEVFAEQGQVRDLSDRCEYLITALEPRTVGEDREAGRPAHPIGFGDGDGVEIFADDAPLEGLAFLTSQIRAGPVAVSIAASNPRGRGRLAAVSRKASIVVLAFSAATSSAL